MKALKTAVVSAALALCCVLSPLDADAYTTPIVSLSSGYGSEGAVTPVRINIDSDGIAAYSIELNFDPDVLYFTGAEQGADIDGGTFYCNDSYSEGSIKLVWSASQNRSCNGTAAIVYFRTAYGVAETETPLSLGHIQIADDLEESEFYTFDCEMKLGGKLNKGDVNNDGKVNISDAVAVSKYIVDSEENPLSYTSMANADITGNGTLTGIDSTLIINYCAMLIEEL